MADVFRQVRVRLDELESTGQPRGQQVRFRGRDTELASLIERITSQDHGSHLVFGPRGVGKTALVRVLSNRLRRRRWRVNLISRDKFSSLAEALQRVPSDLGLNSSMVPRSGGSASPVAPRRLVLFDGLDEVPFDVKANRRVHELAARIARGLHPGVHLLVSARPRLYYEFRNLKLTTKPFQLRGVSGEDFMRLAGVKGEAPQLMSDIFELTRGLPLIATLLRHARPAESFVFDTADDLMLRLRSVELQNVLEALSEARQEIVARIVVIVASLAEPPTITSLIEILESQGVMPPSPGRADGPGSGVAFAALSGGVPRHAGHAARCTRVGCRLRSGRGTGVDGTGSS